MRQAIALLLVLSAFVCGAYCFLDFKKLAFFPGPAEDNEPDSPEKLTEPKLEGGKTYLEPYKAPIYCHYKGFNKFDYIALVHRWPAAYCASVVVGGTYCKVNLIKPITNATRDKNRKIELNYWILEGFRPELNPERRIRGKAAPECCDKDDTFDYESLSSKTKRRLDLYWSELNYPEILRKEYVNKGSWAHEWLQHGTCVKNYNETYYTSQERYFETAFDLYTKYNISQVYKSLGIIPSMNVTYSVKNITESIQREVGKRPFIGCKWASEFYQAMIQVIAETWLCFDKSLNLIDCPSNSTLEYDFACVRDEVYHIEPSALSNYYVLKDGNLVVYRPSANSTSDATAQGNKQNAEGQQDAAAAQAEPVTPSQHGQERGRNSDSFGYKAQ